MKSIRACFGSGGGGARLVACACAWSWWFVLFCSGCSVCYEALPLHLFFYRRRVVQSGAGNINKVTVVILLGIFYAASWCETMQLNVTKRV